MSRGLRVRATALPAASEPAALPARPPAVAVGRRRALGGAASVALASALAAAQPALAAASAKAPPGFTLFTDATKGYAFAYPVGWGVRLAHALRRTERGRRHALGSRAPANPPAAARIAPRT